MNRSVKVCALVAAAGLVALACSRASEDAPAPKFVANAGVVPMTSEAAAAAVDAVRNIAEESEKEGGLDPHGPAEDRADDDPRSCTFQVPEQSCIPGPEAVDFGCRSDCGSACATCKDGCQAKGGGAAVTRCHDTCLATRDACATKCPQEIAAWEAAVRHNHGCKAKKSAFDICTRAFTCVQACKDGDDEHSPCRARCERIHAAGCDRKFLDDVDLGLRGPYDYSP
jgi:hypothetical protein